MLLWVGLVVATEALVLVGPVPWPTRVLWWSVTRVATHAAAGA